MQQQLFNFIHGGRLWKLPCYHCTMFIHHNKHRVILSYPFSVTFEVPYVRCDNECMVKADHTSGDNCDIAVEYLLLSRMKSYNKHLYNIPFGYGFSSSGKIAHRMMSSVLKDSLSLTWDTSVTLNKFLCCLINRSTAEIPMDFPY